MPTRNVNLTAELDRFVATSIATGRYENASEVIRAGLRALEEREQLHQAKLAALSKKARRAESPKAMPSSACEPSSVSQRADRG